jgi:hypothetical protein
MFDILGQSASGRPMAYIISAQMDAKEKMRDRLDYSVRRAFSTPG